MFSDIHPVCVGGGNRVGVGGVDRVEVGSRDDVVVCSSDGVVLGGDGGVVVLLLVVVGSCIGVLAWGRYVMARLYGIEIIRGRNTGLDVLVIVCIWSLCILCIN